MMAKIYEWFGLKDQVMGQNENYDNICLYFGSKALKIKLSTGARLENNSISQIIIFGSSDEK